MLRLNMMRKKINILILIVALIFANGYVLAQNSVQQAITFTKTVHNFGKISIAEGAKHCTFEFKNTSDKPIVINNILSSCGCTTPQWPKKPIMPGESGKVEVTYLNDQGPNPFDKTLTVYTSASPKPIILRITGLAYENEKSMKEMFPVSVGVLGMKNNTLRGGQIAQGNSKSGGAKIANVSNKSITVKFTDITPGLSISVEPQTIEANGIAEISYTIDTKAAKNWGNTTYSAAVLCNGVKAPAKINVESMIVDNFSTLTKEEKNKASMVLATSSSYNFGEVEKGKEVVATFNLRNTGYSPLEIYKIESEKEVIVNSPQNVAAGEKFTVTAKIDTSKCSGEEIFTITLVTNSPNRPLVNLFVTGKVL